MIIETKYNIGDHIWNIYEHNGEICLYDDYIGWICYENNELRYGLKITCNDFKGENIILYNEKEKLVDRIYELMEEINKKEKGE